MSKSEKQSTSQCSRKGRWTYYSELMRRIDNKVVIDPSGSGRAQGFRTIEVEHYVGTPVIGKTLCLTPEQAREFKCPKPWAHISMAFAQDQKDWWFGYRHLELDQPTKIDTLEFSVTAANREAGPNPFCAKYARMVKEFVDRNWNRVRLFLITHGMLEVSLGVARAICSAHATDTIKETECALECRIGNPYVYETVLKELTS